MKDRQNNSGVRLIYKCSITMIQNDNKAENCGQQLDNNNAQNDKSGNHQMLA